MDPHLRRVNGKAEASRKEAYGSRPKVKKKYESTANSSKKPLPEIGPTRLLDLPLGVKLPIFPGTRNIYYTTNLCEKLYQPSYGFNLNDPYCRLMDTTYNSLHDPHLKSYYTRKDMLRKLSTDGFITIDGRVTCTLKELNNYRHYLTTLKLDFERNYIREQKMLCKQVHDCYIFENSYTTAKDQQWLFAEKSPVEPAAFSCRTGR